MKFGTSTNQVFSKTTPVLPSVGDSSTLIYWSDCYAYTVVAVEKKCIFVTRDLSERTDANVERGSQHYSYSTDTEAVPVKAILRKDGKYY